MRCSTQTKMDAELQESIDEVRVATFSPTALTWLIYGVCDKPRPSCWKECNAKSEQIFDDQPRVAGIAQWMDDIVYFGGRDFRYGSTYRVAISCPILVYSAGPVYILSSISPPVIVCPVKLAFTIPAACKSRTRLKMRPSQPFAATQTGGCVSTEHCSDLGQRENNVVEND